MLSLLSATQVHLHHPDSSLHTIRTDVKNALDEIYTATNHLERRFPNALFTMASNFIQANHKRTLPKHHQHISYPTRALNILGHCYTTIKDTYCSMACPHFGKPDHNAAFLFPAYKLKWEDPSQN
eukprot:g31434.t1